MRVDLNCDMGESFGAWRMGDDRAMLDLVSSANIACGFHAGDPQTMLASASLAKERGVALGAHPGFPDLQGFGRRRILGLAPRESSPPSSPTRSVRCRRSRRSPRIASRT